MAVAGDKKADDKDPNRMICEKQAVPGSRLATKRVCMTAAEWEARRLRIAGDREGPDASEGPKRQLIFVASQRLTFAAANRR